MGKESITLSMELAVTSSNVLRIIIHWLSARSNVGLTQGSLIPKEDSLFRALNHSIRQNKLDLNLSTTKQLLPIITNSHLDCKTIGLFSKSLKKLVKRGVRVEPHTLVGRVRREKKKRLSVFHTMSLFRPGGSKMSSSCQISVSNSAPFVNLIHSVIDFEGE